MMRSIGSLWIVVGDNNMNVVYSSDNNYARHVGISITSLYEKNRNVKELRVFLIDDGISKENHKKLDNIAKKYNRTINYVSFEAHKEYLLLNNKKEMPMSAYARLFVAELLPAEIERVLYLDCDTIVCDNLEALWSTDLQGNTIGSVEDVMSCILQDEVGISETFHYFCSGVILIDLNKWRKTNAQQRMLDYLKRRNGVVACHDQTILNGIFWNDCLMLHPRYDALTPAFLMSYQNLKVYFNIWDQYYSKCEIKESVRNPAIIHYTSSNIGRPWENSAHPKAKIYQEYWKDSEWSDIPLSGFKPTCSEKELKVLWLYRHIPVKAIQKISGIRTAFRRKNT